MKCARGFAALISAILLSGVLTAFVFGESASGFWSRYGQRDAENNMRNRALADSCIYEALLEYKENPAVAALEDAAENPQNILLTPIDQCTIDKIVQNGNTSTFYVHVYSRNIYVGIIATATQDASSGILRLTSWTEVPDPSV